MTRFTRLFLFAFAVLTSPFLSGQETPGWSSIETQFDLLIRNANNWKQYEVVKEDSLLILRENTLKKIQSLKAEIENLKKSRDSLNQDTTRLKISLDSTTVQLRSMKNKISFLGFSTNTGTFRGIMWGLVIVLGLLLAFFIYKFKNNFSETREAREKLAQKEAEFEEFRQKAMEKQQDMGRKLQDERNKSERNKPG